MQTKPGNIKKKITKKSLFLSHLENFNLSRPTKIEYLNINGNLYPKYINEFWTAKQRQSNSIHEVSYRACFKPELVNFFLQKLTIEGDVVYDPFAGRGTTLIEAALNNRNIISNDINPLSKILCKSRINPPKISELIERLLSIPINNNKLDIDLTMFYHPDTEKEILSIRKYLLNKEKNKTEDKLDLWIKMVMTNRLTGHSKGFFSVYTLPPNQAVSQKRQIEINKKLKQIPEYRSVIDIVIKKTKNLTSDLTDIDYNNLYNISNNALFLTKDSRETSEIKDNSVSLIVTSPPFLDVVQYAQDNWLRCWFNGINAEKIEKGITIPKKVEIWNEIMFQTLKELFRVVKNDGFVIFEVGEVKNGKIRLDEQIVPLAIMAGFECLGVMINDQIFSKTANIWGISNNSKGTNTNRLVLLYKK